MREIRSGVVSRSAPWRGIGRILATWRRSPGRQPNSVRPTSPADVWRTAAAPDTAYPYGNAEFLSAGDERLRDFALAGADWFAELDDQFRLSWISEPVVGLFGVGARDALARRPWDIPGIDRAEGWELLREQLERRQPFREMNVSFADRTGGRQWRRISGVPVFDRNRIFRGYRCVVRDITVEEEARRQMAELEMIGRLGQWYWDVDSGTIECSEELYRLFERPAAGRTLTKSQFLSQFHPEDRHGVSGAFDRAAESGDRFESEGRIVDSNGRLHFIWFTGSGRKGRKGRITAVYGVIRDITEMRRTERDLADARKRAELAARIKSEFLANVSHELLTPLNAVVGFAQIMARQTFGPLGNPRYLTYAADIAASGQHLLGMIYDIIDTANFEAGRLELELEPGVNLSEILDAALEQLARRADEKQIFLRRSVAPAIPAIVGDRRRLFQMITHLLSNAITFNRSGGSVHIELSPAGTGVEFLVSDTGIGMKPNEIALALTPFGQVHGKANTRYPGGGLGLPISKAIASLHGGHLAIESSRGSGTTVTVWLPDIPPSNWTKRADTEFSPVGDPYSSDADRRNF